MAGRGMSGGLHAFTIRPGEAGFRRNQLIDPQPGLVEAEIEDDYHHFKVALGHDGTTVREIRTEAVRWPWSTCPAAGPFLAERLTGAALDALAAVDPPQAHCTHQHELALLAAAHAHDTAPTLYSTFVKDAEGEVRLAELYRNGALLMAWDVRGSTIVSPGPLEGYDLRRFKLWEAELPADLRIPARVLRRVIHTSAGRRFNFDQVQNAGLVTVLLGGCYTFQPERAAEGHRTTIVHDFAKGPPPLADRIAQVERRVRA
jgi:hypothetical protein